ncbi:hypothetical protein V8C86DRAFT_2718150 [Haematococcus lacustris]
MIRGHFPAALFSAFLLFGCSSAAVWEEVCATAARSIDSNCGPELKFAMARLNMSTDSVSWDSPSWTADALRTRASVMTVVLSNMFGRVVSNLLVDPQCCRASCAYVAQTCACMDAEPKLRNVAMAALYNQWTSAVSTQCTYMDVNKHTGSCPATLVSPATRCAS